MALEHFGRMATLFPLFLAVSPPAVTGVSNIVTQLDFLLFELEINKLGLPVSACGLELSTWTC